MGWLSRGVSYLKCFQSAFDPIIEPTPRLGCHHLASAFADDNPASDKVLNGASQRLLVWGDFIHHPAELLAEFSARQAQMSSAQVSSVSSGGYQDFEIRAVVFEGKFKLAAQRILWCEGPWVDLDYLTGVGAGMVGGCLAGARVMPVRDYLETEPGNQRIITERRKLVELTVCHGDFF